jgi:hypothetical protein
MRFKKKDIMEIAKSGLPSKEELDIATKEFEELNLAAEKLNKTMGDNPFIKTESKKVVKTIKVEQLR